MLPQQWVTLFILEFMIPKHFSKGALGAASKTWVWPN